MLVCCAAALLCGCSDSPRDKQGRLVAEKNETCADEFIMHNDGMVYRFKYVVIDGHEYLLGRHDRGICVTHSPKCECKKW